MIRVSLSRSSLSVCPKRYMYMTRKERRNSESRGDGCLFRRKEKDARGVGQTVCHEPILFLLHSYSLTNQPLIFCFVGTLRRSFTWKRLGEFNFLCARSLPYRGWPLMGGIGAWKAPETSLWAAPSSSLVRHIITLPKLVRKRMKKCSKSLAGSRVAVCTSWRTSTRFRDRLDKGKTD